MKNLKTLTALAAVMLAGLAAPMATADHGGVNCAQDDTGNVILRPLPGLSLDKTGTLQTGNEHDVIELPVWAAGDSVFIADNNGDLKMSVYKAVGDDCTLVQGPTSGDSYAYDSDDDETGAKFFVVIERDGSTDSEDYTLRRAVASP